MTKIKVGIQGVRASFHDMAATSFFGTEGSEGATDFSVVECPSFKSLCEKLAHRECDYSLMAIENTIAGSILTNYGLLEKYQFKIVGEVYLRIEMNLMALAGQKIEDIKYVQSHPMALLQCEAFFHKYPHLKLLEASDTAESAKTIAEKKLLGYATVAGVLAAKTYGLQILHAGIETDKRNYTRFLVLTLQDNLRDLISDGKEAFGLKASGLSASSFKASLRFETPNKPGGLVSILEIFRDHDVNMTKIQSVPILGKPYQYSIHVDVEWSVMGDFIKVKKQLGKKALNLIYFGEYERGDLGIL